MLTANGADLPSVLVRELQYQYLIPQGAIRVWGAAEPFATLPFARAVGDAVKRFATRPASPSCGGTPGFAAGPCAGAPGGNGGGDWDARGDEGREELDGDGGWAA